MGKKLALKGHPTRGKEVIGVLRMMGGRAVDALKGNTDWYAIDECTDNLITIYGYNYINSHNFITFTLEEFLEKYPFKVGDKIKDCYGNPVTIKSMSWHDGFKTMVYDFEETEDVLCAEDIESVNDTDDNTKPSKMKNVLAELLEHIKTTPKEELERDFEELEEWSNVGPTFEEFRAFCESVNRKPKYPTTYAECCKVLKNELNDNKEVEYFEYKYDLLDKFKQLLICRDAYWKIAGEQMGLDKPWKHNYLKDANTIRYAIYNTGDEIVKLDGKLYRNYILCFPTEEMRDAFYENFKDMIENCKELL